MGWKGTLRSINSSMKAAERDAKRRQRELEKQHQQLEKMQELERASYDIAVFENNIELLQSLHKDCSTSINWQDLASTPKPKQPNSSSEFENEAKEKLKIYKPKLFDKLLKRQKAKKEALKQGVSIAKNKDTQIYETALSGWKNQVEDWENTSELANNILNNDKEAKLAAIEQTNPFDEISTIGSYLQFEIENNSLLHVKINIHSSEIIPNEIKSLLKTGRLSVKKMPKGQFNELFQDYVCSSVIRIAREIFAILPDNLVVISAYDKLLNSKTGHLEELPILSVCFSKETLSSLNMNLIDPSDAMDNFIHNMSFKKTKGFEAIELVNTSHIKDS